VPRTGVGVSPYKLLGPGCPEEGPGPYYVVHVFVFLGSVIICRLYKLTLSYQAQFTLRSTVSLSDLVPRFLCQFALATLPQKKKCLTGARTRSRQPGPHLKPMQEVYQIVTHFSVT
jgi:hypothetical protein